MLTSRVWPASSGQEPCSPSPQNRVNLPQSALDAVSVMSSSGDVDTCQCFCTDSHEGHPGVEIICRLRNLPAYDDNPAVTLGQCLTFRKKSSQQQTKCIASGTRQEQKKNPFELLPPSYFLS
ncbi:hypothetical protein BaRGS_00031642 [Batillaria attramentaria]|uniref:EF-1-gamma C-terminal domain-containing protein n=1 Tax=Batillaria attramentaria TaxID=370345 RepID=A0ABD0JQN6_9CAEN